ARRLTAAVLSARRPLREGCHVRRRIDPHVSVGEIPGWLYGSDSGEGRSDICDTFLGGTSRLSTNAACLRNGNPTERIADCPRSAFLALSERGAGTPDRRQTVGPTGAAARCRR